MNKKIPAYHHFANNLLTKVGNDKRTVKKVFSGIKPTSNSHIFIFVSKILNSFDLKLDNAIADGIPVPLLLNSVYNLCKRSSKFRHFFLRFGADSPLSTAPTVFCRKDLVLHASNESPEGGMSKCYSIIPNTMVTCK